MKWFADPTCWLTAHRGAGIKGKIAQGIDTDRISFDDDIRVSRVFRMGKEVDISC